MTVLETGAPVRSGTLRLELTRSPGNSTVFTAQQPTRDGLFIPVGALETPGTYAAKIVVVSDQAQETIELAPIIVHADLASAFEAADADASGDVPNAVPFLLEQQWKIGLLMQQAQRQSLTQRLLVPGEIEAPQGAMAMVSAPLAGRLLPMEAKALPQLGDQVTKGQVLAYLEPPLTTADYMQLSANETGQSSLAMEVQVREFDLQTKSLEVEQAMQQSSARLAFAQKALHRIESLRANELGTEAELEAAQRDLELAANEKQGAEGLQQSLLKAEQSLAALREQITLLPSASAAPNQLRIALVAPISGEIVAAQYVEGEQVDSQSSIYTILDPDRVWITAHISEFDLASVGDSPGALLKFSALPNQSFDVLGAMGGRIANFGRVVDPASRTVMLRYEMPNPQGLFRIGMFADVFLETQTAVQAIAVPEQAVVMDNGRPVAFVLIDGETFQKRDLKLGIRDGALVEVLAGIEEGDRVVTNGAYLVRLASASPASFGAGHAH